MRDILRPFRAQGIRLGGYPGRWPGLAYYALSGLAQQSSLRLQGQERFEFFGAYTVYVRKGLLGTAFLGGASGRSISTTSNKDGDKHA